MAIAPGMYRNRKAIVMEIISPSAGDVYRYRVLFADGASETFFGFELAPDTDD